MKRKLQVSVYALWMTAMFLPMSLKAQNAEQKPVTVTAGGLQEALKGHADVSTLILVGEMNATDFGYLRDLQGIDTLNLAGIKIVAGGSFIGDPYLDEPVKGKVDELPDFFLFDKSANDLLRPLGRSLVHIVLPDELVAIGERTFQGSKIARIEFPETLIRIGSMAFGYCANLIDPEFPKEMERIGDMAFTRCNALVDIGLPETLQYLGASAFEKCDALQNITLPNTIDSIRSGTFAGCTALEQADIRKDAPLRFVGRRAFQNCSAMEVIQLGFLLDSIGPNAFDGCASLLSVTLNSPRLRSIPMEAFKGCKVLTEFVLPAAVTQVGPSAFAGCERLSSVVFSPYLESIMGNAFGKTALEKVILPSSVKRIGYAAFVDCAALKEVFLPESLDMLGEHVFGRCNALSLVSMPAKEPPVEDINGLEELANIPIYVLEESIAKYKAAKGWKEMKKLSADKLYTYNLSEGTDLSAAMGETSPTVIGRLKLTGQLNQVSADKLSEMTRLYDLDLTEAKTAGGTIDPVAKLSPEQPLRRLLLPSDLSELPISYLANRNTLLELQLPATLTKIGESAFENCSALQAVELPAGLNEIGVSAFSGCGGLQRMTLPEGIEIVSDWAFSGCVGLKELQLSGNTVELGEYSLFNCSGLSTLTLPAPVNEIKAYALYGCDNLVRINSIAAAPPTPDNEAFYGLTPELITVAVPTEEAKEAYESNEIWSVFTLIVDPVLSNAKVQSQDSENYAVRTGSRECIIVNTLSKGQPYAIYNLSGCRVDTGIANVGETRVKLPAGIYLLSLDGFIRKFIIN